MCAVNCLGNRVFAGGSRWRGPTCWVGVGRVQWLGFLGTEKMTQREDSQVTAGAETAVVCRGVGEHQGLRQVQEEARQAPPREASGQCGPSPRGFRGVRSRPLHFIWHCLAAEARDDDCVFCQPAAHDTSGAQPREAWSSKAAWCPRPGTWKHCVPSWVPDPPSRTTSSFSGSQSSCAPPDTDTHPSVPGPWACPLGDPAGWLASVSLGFVTICTGRSLRIEATPGRFLGPGGPSQIHAEVHGADGRPPPGVEPEWCAAPCLVI